MSKTWADELIEDRRVEEIRETNRERIQVTFADPRYQSVAARVYLRLAGIWGLDDVDAERLINIRPGCLDDWREKELDALDEQAYEKISYLMGIYRTLCLIYDGNRQLIDRWMTTTRNDDICSGVSPLTYLIDKGVFGVVRMEYFLESVLSRIHNPH